MKHTRRTCPPPRIQRAILAGLAAGLIAGVAGAGDANAQTLTEYQSYLAAKQVVSAEQTGKFIQTNVAELNSGSVKQIRIAGQGSANVDLNGGDVLNKEVEFRASDKTFDKNTGSATNQGESSEYNLVFHADYGSETWPKTDEVADLTKAKFSLDGGSEAVILNGTVKMTPENIYGGDGGHITVGQDPSDGWGDGDGGETSSYNPDVTATLQLVGGKDSTFNTSWTNEAGETVTGSPIIVVKKNGILAADSSLLYETFQDYNGNSLVIPWIMREDAKDAISFHGAELHLTDYADDSMFFWEAGDTFVNSYGLTDTFRATMNTNFGPSQYLALGGGEKKIFSLTDLQNNNTVKFRTIGADTWAGIQLKDGDTTQKDIHFVTTNTGTGGITFYFGDELGKDGDSLTKVPDLSALKNTDASADLSGASFMAWNSPITFANGNVTVSSEYYNLAGYGEGTAGIINIGDGNTSLTPKVTLTGELGYYDGREIPSSYISLNKGGTLALNSANLFTTGQTALGTATDAGALTDVAKKAILYNGGTIEINDALMSDAYKASAEKLLKDAGYNVTFAATGVKAPDFVDISGLTGDSAYTNKGITLTDDGTSKTSLSVKLMRPVINIIPKADGVGYTIALTADLSLGYQDVKNGQYIGVNGDTPTSSIPVTLQLDGKDLTIGQGQSGELAATVTSEADKGSTSTIHVGKGTQTVDAIDTAKGNTYTIDLTQGATLTAPLTVGEQATMNLKGDGSLADSLLTLKDKATLNVTSTAEAVTLRSDATTDATVNIGNDKTAGKLALTDASITKGITFFLDPAWDGSNDITKASELANPTTTVDHLLTVGQNSVASYGTSSNELAEKAFAETKATWGADAITAALYLHQPITLDETGGLKVDGSLTSSNVAGKYATAGTAAFGANSLLMVNAATVGSSPVLSGTGTLSIDPAAKLAFTGTTDGQKVTMKADTITLDEATKNGTNWYTKPEQGKNLLLDFRTSLTKGENGEYTFAVKPVTEGTGDYSDRNPVAKYIRDRVTSGDKLYKLTLGKSASEAAKVFNTVTQISEAAGATYSLVRSALDASEVATSHVSLRHDPTVMRSSVAATQAPAKAAGSAPEAAPAPAHQSDIWAEYGYSHYDVDGLSSAPDYDGHMNTLHVGANFGSGALRGGIGLMYGTGASGGDYESSDNQVGGISLYGAYRNKDYNLIGDIGFYGSKGDLSGLVDTNSYAVLGTIGLDNEYVLRSGADVFVPHIGLRYNYVRQKAIDELSDLGISTGSGGSASFFTMPLGVAYHRDFASQDQWHYGVDADLGVIFAMGGREADTDVTFRGTAGSYTDKVRYDLYDGNTFYTKLGFTASSDKLDYGLSYQYRHSSESSSHSIMAGINFKF